VVFTRVLGKDPGLDVSSSLSFDQGSGIDRWMHIRLIDRSTEKRIRSRRDRVIYFRLLESNVFEL
jgi:hypothetical protein